MKKPATIWILPLAFAAVLAVILIWQARRISSLEEEISSLAANRTGRPSLIAAQQPMPAGASGSRAEASGGSANQSTPAKSEDGDGSMASAATGPARSAGGLTGNEQNNAPGSRRLSLRQSGEVPLSARPWNPADPYSSSQLVSGDPIVPAEQTSAGRSWGPEQAAGQPDTNRHGDIRTAWASKSPDAGSEWLELTYERPVALSEIMVRETYNPGAISRVVAITPEGQEVTVWAGRTDPASDMMESVFPATGRIMTGKVRVELDTSRVPGWNEIDAVQIKGKDGTSQWASSVRASSTYAE